jgi:hypothetical protein
MNTCFTIRFLLRSILITLVLGQSPVIVAASNLVFTPLVPCRILDTRTGQGNFLGPIAGNHTISIQTNLSDFTAQGGNDKSCGMPTGIDAAAIMLNVVAVSPPGGGNLRVYPFNEALPNASTVNFVPGQTIANNTVVGQCINCNADVSIFVATQADVIVDVVGYFDKPSISYKIGDTGPQGGKVFAVDATGEHGLEAQLNDLGTYTWVDAKTAALNQGDSWRLPTKDELNLLYLQKSVVGGFKDSVYWSSTENGSNAWNQSFANGNQDNNTEALSMYARAVRTF